MRTTVALTSVLLCLTTLTYAQEPARPIESALVRLKAWESSISKSLSCIANFMTQNPDATRTVAIRLVMPEDTEDLRNQKLNDQTYVTQSLKEQILLVQNNVFGCLEKNFPVTNASAQGRVTVDGLVRSGNNVVDLLNGSITFGEFNKRKYTLDRENETRDVKCTMDELVLGEATRPECKFTVVDPQVKYPKEKAACYRIGFAIRCNE